MGLTVGAVCALDIGGVNMQFTSVKQNSVYQFTDTGLESISGFLDSIEERVAEGLVVIDYSILLEPSILDLDTIFPLLGMAETPTDTFTMSDTLPSFTVIMKIGTNYHTFATNYVNDAIFRHARGSHPQRLELRIFGTSETIAGSDPGIATLVDGVGYPFPDVAVTLAGNAHQVDRLAMAFKNNLVREWNNSTTATGICPSSREVYIGTSTPYYTTNEKALYTAVAGASPSVTGAAAAVTYTRGTRSTAFAYENAKLLATPPSILAKNKEVRLDQFYRCYRTVANPVCVVTHDATV